MAQNPLPYKVPYATVYVTGLEGWAEPPGTKRPEARAGDQPGDWGRGGGGGNATHGPRPPSRFPNSNQAPHQILPKFLTSETPLERFTAWEWGWQGGPKAWVWDGECATLEMTKPDRTGSVGAHFCDPGPEIQSTSRAGRS